MRVRRDGRLSPNAGWSRLLPMAAAGTLAVLWSGQAGAGETAYEYDALGRLIKVTNVTTGAVQIFNYDDASNRDTVALSLGVSFSINDAVVTEGGTLTFTVTKAGVATGSNAVNYATANGGAVAGSDYTAASGTLTFTSSDVTKTINVATTQETSVEGNETLFVNLSSPTNGATLADGQGVGTINNDDGGNTPPIAVDDYVAIGSFTSIQIFPLIGAGADIDTTPGDSLSILSAGPVQGDGGSISISGDKLSITYTKPSTPPIYGCASFEYVVKDLYGATDVGNITVQWGAFCDNGS